MSPTKKHTKTSSPPKMVAEDETQAIATSLSRLKPLVFISHDSRDAALASAFGNLLTDASGGVLKHFSSSDKRGNVGIEFGAEWYSAIMNKIGDATDVVAILTQNSLDRPWILYEAGVAKGRLAIPVLGLAIGIPLEKASTGPFAQFQNSADDEDSLTKLVLQLIKRNPEATPREEAVRLQVRSFREQIQSLRAEDKIEQQQNEPEGTENVVAKLFEEVKITLREFSHDFHRQIRKSSLDSPGPRRIPLTPRTLETAERLLFEYDSPLGRAVGWCSFLDRFKEYVPWLYVPGIDMYRAMIADDSKKLFASRAQLLNVLHYLMSDSRALRVVLRHYASPDYAAMAERLLHMVASFVESVEPGTRMIPTARLITE